MKALTLAEILAIEDLPIHEFPVEQWGGTVFIRSMRADEKSELEKQFTKRRPSDDPAAFRRAVLRAAWVKQDGSPFLPDDDSAKAVMRKSADAIEAIFEEACVHNGLRKKDVQELEKNSETPQPDASPSG